MKIMKWEKVLELLKSNIQLDLHLTPEKSFKIVREIPPYKCRNYNDVDGFRVQVGENTHVNIPLTMLETIFEASKRNNNIYNRAIFKENFPRELNAKPCNVHSVGKLFEHAGIMQKIDKRNYIIAK
jgi:hypothetical protein